MSPQRQFIIAQTHLVDAIGRPEWFESLYVALTGGMFGGLNSIQKEIKSIEGISKELLDNRLKLREALKDITPQQIKALKNKSPEEYQAILKSISRKLFPNGANIQLRKEGEKIDYQHFLTDMRGKFIHTLPNTLKNKDIKANIKEGDIDKIYLIKKYFDTDIQKDLWDIIVMHGNEIKTKIPRIGRKGQDYIESRLFKGRQ